MFLNICFRWFNFEHTMSQSGLEEFEIKGEELFSKDGVLLQVCACECVCLCKFQLVCMFVSLSFMFFSANHIQGAH